MTVLATDWLSISINLLLFVFVVVCLLMSMIILMQRPKNEGLGAAFGSGTTDQLFGARTTNVLQKATVYLATLFFVLTLTLAVMIGKQNAGRKGKSLVAEVPAAAPLVVETPAVVEAPPLEPDAVTPPVEVPPALPIESPTAPAETTPVVPAETTPAEPVVPAETPAEPAEAPAEPAETPVEPEMPVEPAEEDSATPPPADAEEAPAEPADSTPPEQP
jgi:preprotein translocase subunit SecG